MEQRSLIFLGGGGHARVVLDAARACGRRVDGAHDDDARAPLCAIDGVEHLGEIPDVCDVSDREYFVAIGDLGFRERCIARIARGAVAAALVHPSAIVSPAASIGDGVFIGPGAIVNAGAEIRAHAIVNSGAIVEHDCVVGVNAHIAPRAVLGGGARVGDHTLVGIGAAVLPGMRIGKRCVLGGGAVVVSGVEDGVCVVGNPARPLGIATTIGS